MVIFGGKRDPLNSKWFSIAIEFKNLRKENSVNIVSLLVWNGSVIDAHTEHLKVKLMEELNKFGEICIERRFESNLEGSNRARSQESNVCH